MATAGLFAIRGWSQLSAKLGVIDESGSAPGEAILNWLRSLMIKN